MQYEGRERKYMDVYEVMRCDNCGELYKGVFRVGEAGKVECIEGCTDKVYLEDIKYEEKEMGGVVLQETVKSMLKRDLSRIYLRNRVAGKDVLYSLRDNAGEIEDKKLYYQDNPIDLIIQLQKKAYNSLTYLEMGKTELAYFAENVYKLYKEARERKYTEEEVMDIWGLLGSEEMERIDLQVK